MAITITKPTINGDGNNWGTKLNGVLDALVTGVNAAQSTADSAGSVSLTAPGATQARSAAQRLADAVNLEDYYDPAHGTNWTVTMAAAASAVNGQKTIMVNGYYTYTSQLNGTLPANTTFQARGPECGFYNVPVNDVNGKPIEVRFANVTGDGVKFIGLRIDQHILDPATSSTLNGQRVLQITNSIEPEVRNCTILNGSNWHLTFNGCTRPKAIGNTVLWGHAFDGVSTGTGGTDGIHFLDCNDGLAQNNYVITGDDGIAVTYVTAGSYAGCRILQTTGGSARASLVTIGFENLQPNITITHSNTVVDGVFPVSLCRDGVVKVVNTATDVNGNATITYNIINPTVKNVRGQGQAPGVRFAGSSVAHIINPVAKNIEVESTNQNGFQASNCNNVDFDVSGVALGQNTTPGNTFWSGVSLSRIVGGRVRARSVGSAYFGVYVNNCGGGLQIEANVHNNGALNFPNASSANLDSATAVSDGGGVRVQNLDGTDRGPIDIRGAITADNGMSRVGVQIVPGLAVTVRADTVMRGHTNYSNPGARGAMREDVHTTVDPTTTDDASKAYTAGHKWINESTKAVFFLADPTTGAAKWMKVQQTAKRPTVRTPAFAESYTREGVTFLAQACILTGQETATFIVLSAGQVVTKIGFHSGTAANTPTHQWYTLRDPAGNLLAVTTDDTTTAWAADADKPLSIAQTYSGGTFTSATSYTIPSDGLYRLGIVVTATTVPQLAAPAGGGLGGMQQISPQLVGRNNATGLTTPSTAPAVHVDSAAVAWQPYCWVG